MFLLMNTPVDSSRRLLAMWGGWLMSAPHRWPKRTGLIGATIYPSEVALTALLHEGPSTEIIVCRKTAAGNRTPS